MKRTLFATGVMLACSLAASAASSLPELITDPQGEKINYIESGEGWFIFMGIVPAQDSFTDMPTDIVYGADNKVYIKNVIPRFPTDTYVEALKDGDRIILTLPQAVKIEKRDGAIFDYWVDRMELEVDEATKEGVYWPSEKRDVAYTIQADGSIKMEESDGNWAIGITNNEGLWQGYADWNCIYTPNDYKPLTPPEGLEVEEMQMITNYTGFNVGVAFDGNDVYLRGVCYELPDAWIKGTLDGNSVTFENAQYLGTIPSFQKMGFFFGGEAYPDPKYIWGYSLADKFVMDYDAATKTLSTKQAIIINENPDYLMYMYAYRYPLIHPVTGEHSQVPQNIAPISYVPYGYSGDCTGFKFYLPNLSTDNYILPKDELYWSIYIDDELYTFEPYLYEGLKKDMYEVPFNCDVEDIENPGENVLHTVYINGLQDFEKIGYISLRKIPGQEEPLYSELVEFTKDGNGVEEISIDTDAPERIFDLNGLPVSTPVKGRIYIVDKGSKTIKRIF